MGEGARERERQGRGKRERGGGLVRRTGGGGAEPGQRERGWERKPDKESEVEREGRGRKRG